MNLRALLIGISHYQENDVCTSLQGAVADVEAMAAFLLAQGVAAVASSQPGQRLSAGQP